MIKHNSSPVEVFNRFFDLATKLDGKRNEIFNTFFGDEVKSVFSFKNASFGSIESKSRFVSYFRVEAPFKQFMIVRTIVDDGTTYFSGVVNDRPFSFNDCTQFFWDVEIEAANVVRDVTKYMECEEVAVAKMAVCVN